jgi:hypothetical protein
VPKCYRAFLVGTAFTLLLLTSDDFLYAQTGVNVQARNADNFVSGFGVRTAFGFTDSKAWANYGAVADAMQELGVRFHRTRWPGQSVSMEERKQLRNRMRDLWEQRGIKTLFVFTFTDGNGFLDNSKIAGALDYIKRRDDGSVSTAYLCGIEGPNEFNGEHSDWVNDLKSFQLALFNGVNDDPDLRNLPVLSPSLVGGSGANVYQTLGNLNDRCDVGNMHYYPAGFGAYDTTPSVDFVPKKNAARINFTTPSGLKPMWITEYGWFNNLNYNQNANPISTTGEALFAARSHALFWKPGDVDKAFRFEMSDSDSNNTASNERATTYGLINSGSNPQKQWAFYALKNFFAILAEPGATVYTPQDLTMDFANKLGTTEYRLLQKQNGTYFLLLWQELDSYNESNDMLRSIADDAMSISLGNNKKFASWTIFKYGYETGSSSQWDFVTVAGSPTNYTPNKTLDLTGNRSVPQSVMVVKFKVQ